MITSPRNNRFTASALCVAATLAFSLPVFAAAPPQIPLDKVDLEMMTWVEVKDAIAHGKTTALIFNGGTETRGPAAVNGGHTFVARSKADMIALQLGNALALPVLPYSPQGGANTDIPGDLGLTAETFKIVNREITESAIKNGFKNVVLMGDHGGGQKELADLAMELDAKYASQGVRVVYCADAYVKSNADYDKYIETLGLPGGGHGSVNDTAEMIYAEPTPGAWVRPDQLKNQVGAPRPPRATPPAGAPPAPPQTPEQRAAARAAAQANRPPVGSGPGMTNGVSGDGSKSTAAIGKVGYDIHVKEAVEQIKVLLATPPGAAPAAAAKPAGL